MARCRAALESFDDEHAPAAAWTSRLVVIGVFGWLAVELWRGEQLAGARDVVGAGRFGEQAVVADAVEAARQDMDEKAADELGCCEGHALVSIAALDPVVLPLEGDALLIERDQAAVGDGDAMGVARQIGQHRLGAAERAL